MFDKLTYRQKTWLLIVSAIVVFWGGYSLAISKTFDLYSKIEIESQKLQKAKTANNDIVFAQNKLNQLKYKVGKTSPSFEIFQKEVLNKVVPFAKQNKILVNEIKLPHKSIENRYEIQTLQIECRGNFRSLTRLLNHIQKENLGRVCSVDYELRKDHKLKKRFLYATFYIQNYLAL